MTFRIGCHPFSTTWRAHGADFRWLRHTEPWERGYERCSPARALAQAKTAGWEGMQTTQE